MLFLECLETGVRVSSERVRADVKEVKKIPKEFERFGQTGRCIKLLST
jgi:hypothetical protein